MLIAGSLVIGRREKGKDASIGQGLHGQGAGPGTGGAYAPVVEAVALEDEEPDATIPGARAQQQSYKDDVELTGPRKERVSTEDARLDLH